MNQYKTSSLKSYKIPIFFLSFFGGILLFMSVLIGSISYTTSVKFENAETTNAQITNITYDSFDESYDVYIEFYVEGVRYSGKLNYYSSSMRLNDIIEIKYLATDPNEFIYGSNTVINILAIVMGSIDIIILIILFKFIIKNKKNSSIIKDLLKNGSKKSLIISSFELNYSTTINGRHPYFVVCHDDYNDEYYISSKSYMKQNIFFIQERINLFVSRENKEIFYIDTDGYLKNEKNY